jgi:hypothetical protein
MLHRPRLHPDATLRWGMLVLMVLITAPMLLGAGYMTWRSLWFKFGASSAAMGQVVEKVGTSGPHLIVHVHRRHRRAAAARELPARTSTATISVGDPCARAARPGECRRRADWTTSSNCGSCRWCWASFGGVLAASTWFMFWQMGRT